MKRAEIIGTLVLLAVFAFFPLAFPNAALLSIGVFTILYASIAVSWNIFSGYTGYISLGHAVFFGVGAYSFTFMVKGWNIEGGYLPFLLLIPVGLIASLSAIPVGWIFLRTRKQVFIVVTIAAVFIMQLLAYNFRSITGGSGGFLLPVPSWGPDFFNFPFYYVGFILLVLSVALSWWIRRSKYGLCLLAIREDEDRARGLGINTEAYKLTALVFSAFFTGTAGAMLSYFTGSISPPDAFSPALDVVVALMAFFGGVGTLMGPLFGAMLLEPLQQYLTLEFGAIGLDKIIYGLLLLFIILVLPEGVVPSLLGLRNRFTSVRNVQLPSALKESPVQASEKSEQETRINL
jgi:branched-chain amino acid transport system permease protein